MTVSFLGCFAPILDKRISFETITLMDNGTYIRKRHALLKFPENGAELKETRLWICPSKPL